MISPFHRVTGWSCYLAIVKGNTVFALTTNIESVFSGRMVPHMKLKSPIIIESELLPLVTPGEILHEEFLRPFRLTANALALELHVPANRIQAIVKGRRGITADTALRLAQYFGNSAEFWLNLQQNYELDLARRETLGEIEKQVPRRPPGKAVAAPPMNKKAINTSRSRGTITERRGPFAHLKVSNAEQLERRTDSKLVGTRPDND
jgi:addiction module HigA family antidote